MQTVIVSAYSKAPQNTVMYEKHKMMGVILEIDRQTNIIIDCEVTVLTDIVKNYFKRLLVGVNFSDNIEPVIEKIEKYYLTPSQTSMIFAIKNAQKRYLDACDEEKSMSSGSCHE